MTTEEKALRAMLDAGLESAEVYRKLGEALRLQKRFPEALRSFERAIAMGDESAEAMFGAGSAALDSEREAAAIRYLERAAAVLPDHHGVLHNLAKAQYAVGLVDEAVANFRAAERLHGGPLHRASLAVVIPGAPSATHSDVLAARQAYAVNDLPSPIGSFPSERRPGPLRVGYISSFFHAPNWMKPVWAVINRHDRERFAVHLVSDATPEECAKSGYKHDERDRFLSIRGVDNMRAASQIAGAELDLLIDLNSYSRPQRLEVLAYRPARVVAAWFNQYATSGMPCYDYLIGDPVVIKPEEEPFYVEKIVRVSTTYLTYEVAYPVPPVAQSQANGSVTFGCFASQYKLTPQVIRAWSAILNGAPRSKLLIKNGSLSVDSSRAALLSRFAANGVDSARIVLEAGAPHFDYLAAYDNVDLALDPYPYNGGTTTSEALWQGVPVLCFEGDRWASRQGASLLLAAGLDEFVARDEADYIARGIAFGNHGVPGDRLTMRARLAASKMMDTEGFTREMESIYRRLVRMED